MAWSWWIPRFSSDRAVRKLAMCAWFLGTWGVQPHQDRTCSSGVPDEVARMLQGDFVHGSSGGHSMLRDWPCAELALGPRARE